MTENSKINDGGNAFPQRAKGDGGMSLRDWFAGQALAGILAFPGKIEGDQIKRPSVCCNLAYRMADAMLEARKIGGDA